MQINDQMRKYLEEAIILHLDETHPSTERSVTLKAKTQNEIFDSLDRTSNRAHHKIMLYALELACADLEAAEEPTPPPTVDVAT